VLFWVLKLHDHSHDNVWAAMACIAGFAENMPLLQRHAPFLMYAMLLPFETQDKIQPYLDAAKRLYKELVM
jgi:hypothetical protein